MSENKNMYDVVVVGAGPAGLTAAIYLARAKYRVLVLERETFGGQITKTDEVVNYPGVLHTNGTKLTEVMRQQAINFGADVLLAEALEYELDDTIKKVKTSKGTFSCFGVVLAVGAHPRLAGFEKEKEYIGHGVAYCATCDGQFFEGKKVFVIGGGFAAAEEAVFLTKYASEVTVLVKTDDFTCAKSVADKAYNDPKVKVITNTDVVSIDGDTFVKSITYKNSKTGETTTVKDEKGENIGVFVFVGYEPATENLKGLIDLDERGYIVTDNNKKTNKDGVYAAGDVTIKKLRQVVTATGDGAVCATELEHVAKEGRDKTGIVPEFTMPEEAPKKSESTPLNQNSSSMFDKETVDGLAPLFAKMENNVTIELTLDSSDKSKELKSYMQELVTFSEKLNLRIADEHSKDAEAPFVRIYRHDDSFSGITFHGIPAGHEFTSFMLSVYNSSGKGQPIDDNDRERALSIDKDTDLKILVTLSCTMCPELVASAGRIATLNPKINCNIYDLTLYENLKEKYNVMSVPCLVLNDDKVIFGKKNVTTLLDAIL